MPRVTSLLGRYADPLVEFWILTRPPLRIMKVGVSELVVRHYLWGHPIYLEAVLRIAAITVRRMTAYDDESHWNTCSVLG